MSSVRQSVLDPQKLELAVAALVNGERPRPLALQDVLPPPVPCIGERALHQTVAPFLTQPIYPKNLCHIVVPVYQTLSISQA